MDITLAEYFRFPADATGALAQTRGDLEGGSGFDPKLIRFATQLPGSAHANAGARSDSKNSAVAANLPRELQFDPQFDQPFDPAQVIDNLRFERYARASSFEKRRMLSHPLVRQAYYLMRDMLPDRARRRFQKTYFRDWKNLQFPNWPVDLTVDTLQLELLRVSMAANGVSRIPFVWFWPGGAPSALMMTHDVETLAGREFVFKLMDIDDAFGMKASFQMIPEKRYEIPDEYVAEIRRRNFEFNIHDLNHDGNLFKERTQFLERAKKINEYAYKHAASGFRAGAMYRNQDWFGAFDFSYDMSVPNVAHLEPQRGGCCTVMPYFIGNILELPLTTTQDYSIIHMLDDCSLDLWRRQIKLIKSRNGLISFNTHPDYLIDQRGRALYESLLHALQEMIASEKIWAALPGEIDRWWRARSRMSVEARGNHWEITGPESERARLAFAELRDGRLHFEIEDQRQSDASEYHYSNSGGAPGNDGSGIN